MRSGSAPAGRRELGPLVRLGGAAGEPLPLPAAAERVGDLAHDALDDIDQRAVAWWTPSWKRSARSYCSSTRTLAASTAGATSTTPTTTTTSTMIIWNLPRRQRGHGALRAALCRPQPKRRRAGRSASRNARRRRQSARRCCACSLRSKRWEKPGHRAQWPPGGSCYSEVRSCCRRAGRPHGVCPRSSTLLLPSTGHEARGGLGGRHQRGRPTLIGRRAQPSTARTAIRRALACHAAVLATALALW